MDNCKISLRQINMSYPSSVMNARSLKEEIFSLLRLEKKKELLKDVHALRDFSVEVNEGERVGVIGHNGSGKSTLLKTIAGIYPIESGERIVHGKIRALFDISLGFDFESSGRENILYRGLLLGATPDEIYEKMDEIIAFTDIGEFIDYPVKSYSTGMMVRLAFAVSTSIQGEILLLDEIVGAGDATFMGKARKRIFDLMDQSKLMVFVSHDLETISKVCSRVIWLDHGVKLLDGEPHAVIQAYLDSLK